MTPRHAYCHLMKRIFQQKQFISLLAVSDDFSISLFTTDTSLSPRKQNRVHILNLDNNMNINSKNNSISCAEIILRNRFSEQRESSKQSSFLLLLCMLLTGCKKRALYVFYEIVEKNRIM